MGGWMDSMFIWATGSGSVNHREIGEMGWITVAMVLPPRCGPNLNPMLGNLLIFGLLEKHGWMENDSGTKLPKRMRGWQ